jgi:hypothetical protein
MNARPRPCFVKRSLRLVLLPVSPLLARRLASQLQNFGSEIFYVVCRKRLTLLFLSESVAQKIAAVEVRSSE